MKNLLSKDKWTYLFHTVSHPADGFYEIRHRERGSVAVALILVFLFSVAWSVNRISAGFIVNDIDPRDVNSLTELITVLLFFFLICISNWSITCLMDGKGRLKDIVIAIGYSTLPATVCILLGTVLSRFVSEDEAAFYTMICGIGIFYTLFMMLVGIMTVHNFTLGKTLITLFLTVVAMLLIIFIVLLIVDLINQVYSFLHSIYQELLFRT
ncbi:MAG: YIP1 family protein [Lachnospiraceae bacterium]|nr:YIP1 family protein [Lachnospiraceae bacterium]